MVFDDLSSQRTIFKPRTAFSLTEVLVAVAIILALTSLSVAALSAASGSAKRLRTRSLIAKIDSIIAAQYASYAGRNIEATDDADRGAQLRDISRGDLPDSWSVIAGLTAKPQEKLTSHQQAYVALWNSLDSKTRQDVAVKNSGAECLFLAVMRGGLADCLDCRTPHIDVGDDDNDGMPEFHDAWNRPVGFILEPRNLRLPEGSGKNYFSAALPFDPVVATAIDAPGGMMRPLILSAGADGDYGLEADAAPVAGSLACRDNLTNFDEEARP
jgi:type II secretory pathway pseudopilin PulG